MSANNNTQHNSCCVKYTKLNTPKVVVGFGLMMSALWSSLSWSLEKLVMFGSVSKMPMNIWIRLLPSIVKRFL